MRDDPSLRHRPIAVGGASDRRGVISTCNYEARRYGVHSAMASAHARRLCPDLVILPHRMEVYSEASRAMQNIFHDYAEQVEPLSLDEAFLDVSDSDRCRGSATLIAGEIRERVRDTLGITVSAGVAPNKFLAKVASDWRKPDGLFTLPPDAVAEFVRRLPVKKIPGVGKVGASRLAALGIKTCADLQAYSIFELSERFGSMGARLYHFSRGEDDRPVSSAWRRKSLSVEHTYPSDLPDVEPCLRQLPALLQSLVRRLRRTEDDYRVIKAFVKLKFDDFTTTTLERSRTQVRLDDYSELCREAWQRGGRPVRLLGLGVRFLDLRAERACRQLELFSPLTA